MMPVDAEVTYSVADTNIDGSTVPVPTKLRVHRSIYDQPSFDAAYGLCDPGPPATPWENIKRNARKKWHRKVTKASCDRYIVYDALVRWLPCIEWLRNYKIKETLVTDIIAGLTVGVLNVPQGMAYAMLASCPPVTGLYTSIFPVIIYFLMGTSRQCSMGTFSIVSMMSSKIVLQVTQNKFAPCELSNKTCLNMTGALNLVPGTSFNQLEWTQIQAGSMAAFFVGVWQLILGLVGAGAATVYFSDQLVQGFTCGAAFHVFSSQLKYVFQLPMKGPNGVFKLIKTYITFFGMLGQAHGATVVVAFISLVILCSLKFGINDNRRIMKKLRIPMPAELIVVIIGTIASYFMGLKSEYGVDVVGNIPEGLPPPTMPDFGLANQVIGDTFSIAIVGLAISVTLGLLFANKHGYSIDANQEFKAVGVGNLVGCIFQCFPSGASVARSAVQNDVGGRTQIVSVVQCAMVITVVFLLGRFLVPLPVPCLGAIVMASVLHLMCQVIHLYRLWKISLVDWSIFLVVFLGVIVLDVDIGLGVGVGWAILTVMLRLQKPKVGVLGRMPGTDIYRRIDVYKTAREIPGIKIIRIDAPIYYANARYIHNRLYALANLDELMAAWKDAHPKPEQTTPAVDGPADENFAYTLNLKLGNDDEDDDGPGRRISKAERQRRPTISMEDLTKAVYRYMDEETGEEADTPIKHLVIDCSEICFVDVTGVGFLKRCQTECAGIGVQLFLACTNKPLRDMLKVCGAKDYIQDTNLFVTVHDAVLNAYNAQRTKSLYKGPTRSADGGYVNQLARIPRHLTHPGVDDEDGERTPKEEDQMDAKKSK